MNERNYEWRGYEGKIVFHARASEVGNRSSVEIHLNQFVRALAVEMDVCQGLELSNGLMRRIEDGCHQKR